MKFQLIDLNTKSLEQLRSIFSSIPQNEIMIEIVGIFFQGFFASSLVTQALSYLPRHVHKVTFSGAYYMETHTEKQYIGPSYTKVSERSMNEKYYKTHLTYSYHLGNMLKIFISSLPQSVNSLSLKFKLNPEASRYEDKITKEFKAIFNNMPKNITILDWSETQIPNSNENMASVLQTIPQTVTTLKIGYLDLRCMNKKERNKLYYATGRGLTSLILSNSEIIPSVWDNTFNLSFDGLSDNLRSLALNRNNLGIKSLEMLEILFKQFPLNLIQLDLSTNALSKIGANDLAFLFTLLSEHLTHIDLGDNELLHMSLEDLITTLSGIPLNIKSLRLCEKNMSTISLKELITRLVYLPTHIETLSFSSSNLLGFTVPQFTASLSGLQDSISTLNLSDNQLSSRNPDELYFLFSKIPASIKTLKLNQNTLSSMDAKTLARIFSALPKTLICLDLSENGFNRSYHTHLNQLLHAIPDIKVLIDENSLRIRNDGALVPYSQGQNYGIFRPQRTMQHQKEFARILLVLGQWIHLESNPLPQDIISTILSIIFKSSPIEAERLCKQLQTPRWPSKLPDQISPQIQEECKIEAMRRIHLLTEHDRVLDLSRCGLNRLNEPEMFIELLKKIPKNITSISLRGNGFHYNEKTKSVLITALEFIPEYISYLDLSAHGFEGYDAEALTQLFINLPTTIHYISLTHEKGISPFHQIALRQWPSSYNQITQLPNALQQARSILDDYTKGDSPFWRFLFLHWARQNTDEVAKLVKHIDMGLITNITDLLHELDNINKLNPVGSLAKRISFLTTKSAPLKNKGPTEDFEMATITSVSNNVM